MKFIKLIQGKIKASKTRQQSYVSLLTLLLHPEIVVFKRSAAFLQFFTYDIDGIHNIN